MYQAEMENLNKTVCKAAEIIQENFLLLRSKGEVDNSMFEKLVALGKLMQGRRTVKFLDEGAAATESAEHNEEPENLIFHNIMNLTDLSSVPDGQSPVVMKKRFNDLNGDEDELENESKKTKNSAQPEPFQFSQPKAMKSINFESLAPVSSTHSHDLNMTFDLNAIPAPETKVLSERLNKPVSSSSSATSTSSASSRGRNIRKYF